MTSSNQKLWRAKIAGIGTAVPEKLLTNADLERMVDTSDQWIMERTGIKQRHVVDRATATSDLSAQAAKMALERAGVRPEDVELIVVATITPDMMLPATACLVQEKIGATRCWGFDLSAACSGFLYALQVAAQFVETGAHKYALAIGVDVMSGIVDYTDRTTCVLFGDGGGAALIARADDDDEGYFVDFIHEVDGTGGQYLCLPGGGSRYPTSHDTVDKRMHFVKQDGKAVYKFATRKMPDLCTRILERNGLQGTDVDLLIPHQANKRIIDAAADRLSIPEDRIVVNISEFGNTTAGTLPLAIETALSQNRLHRGDTVLFAVVGAGFSAGAALVKWAY